MTQPPAPKEPRKQKGDAVSNAVRIARIATGEAVDDSDKPAKEGSAKGRTPKKTPARRS